MSQTNLPLVDDIVPKPEPGAKPETLPPHVTADMIRRGLERRYRDGYVVLHEVANAVGWVQSERAASLFGGISRRYIDTIALGMYESTRHSIVAHEIKVSRADWLAELRKPLKAGAFMDLVTHFYVVAPKGVVQVEELPASWGLLVWYPSMIRVARAATEMNPTLTRAFVGALVSRALNPKRTPSAEELPAM